MIAWLERNTPFPPPETALRDPNGLLAAGGDLSPARLLDAYRHGIFPWYSSDEPILWWTPDPRMVLFPAEFKLSRSLAKTLRNRDYEVRLDTSFDAVLDGCAAPRVPAVRTRRAPAPLRAPRRAPSPRPCPSDNVSPTRSVIIAP